MPPSVITPAVNLLSKMSFVSKFVLISTLFLLPLFVLGWGLIKEVQQSINLAQQERQGLAALEKTYGLYIDAIDYRDISLLLRARSDANSLNQVSRKKKVIDKKLHQLLEFDALLPQTHQLDITSLIKSWNDLHVLMPASQGGPEILFLHFNNFVSQTKNLLEHIIYSSQLIHDPDSPTLLLVNLMNGALPDALTDIGRARAMGTYALAVAAIDTHTFNELDRLNDNLEISTTNLSKRFDQAIVNQPKNRSLESITSNLLKSLNDSRSFLYEEIILSENPQLDWFTYYENISLPIAQIKTLALRIIPIINKQINQRIINKQQFLATILSLSIFLLFLIIYLYAGLYYSIHSTITTFGQKAHQVATGNLEVQMKTRSKDEFTALYSAFNTMVDTLRTNQDKLIQASKLQSLGGLITGMAHEINTPLGTAITANSFLQNQAIEMQTSYDNNTLRKQDFMEFLGHIQKTTGLINSNLDRTAKMIRTFKLLSIDSGEHINDNVLLHELFNSFKGFISIESDDKEINYIVDCDKDLHCKTDPDILSVVIGCMVSNSIIHAFSNKDIGTIKISAQNTGQGTVITFSDDGIGMDRETAKKIFEPFYTTSRQSGNIGLGLHIVFLMVNYALGGVLECDSRINEGTTFSILLPNT